MNTSANVDQVKLSLKLVVNKETNKVLFAEAGKDFADVLISFLTLPLGTIARLAAKECDMGPLKIASLSSVYESVSNIGGEYMLTDTCKEMLLRPRNPMEDYCRSLKINVDDTEPTKYYVCRNLVSCRSAPTVMCSTFKNKKCSCGNVLDRQISPKICLSFDGFVKIFSCFMVTDDLCLLPMSLDAKFSIIKKMNIKGTSSLKEIVVDVTKNKLIDLLKCALVSQTPLTDVFLREKFHLQKSDSKIIFPSAFSEQCYTQVKVSLMYQKSNGQLLCAQGKEDLANFLLSILTLPLGAVVRLLRGNSCIGSIDGLYNSVVGLSEDYFNSTELKANLVDLGIAPQFKLSNQVLSISEFMARTYYCVSKSVKYSDGNDYLTDFYLDTQWQSFSNASGGKCSSMKMVDPISENGSAKGFVGGPTVYIATDNISVSPISSFSAVSFINNTDISLGDVEQKEVTIGLKEGLSILKASLTSSMALTNGLAHLLPNVKRDNSLLTKVKVEK